MKSLQKNYCGGCLPRCTQPSSRHFSMPLFGNLLLALLLAFALPAHAFDLGKALGGKSLKIGKTSKEDEIKLGREITGNLLGAAPLVKDAELQKYVNRVGRWVALQSERPDLLWHFGVIESNDLNAFAAPGGYVLLTRGLYRTLENEAQLAGVLAHEIGHVIKKHQLKLIEKQQMLDLGAGVLGESVSKNNDGIKKLIGSGAEICARSLDKDAEFEADRMGVVLAGRAGYEPYGLPEVLQTIGHAGKDDGRVALLFKTHPHPDDRLARLGDAIGDRLDGIKDGKTLPERFYKMKD